MRKDIIVELTNSQIYRAKRKAREMLDGDERLQYAKLSDYAEMIRSTNKGSHVILETEILDEGDERPVFNKMYIRYHAQKAGFLASCRRIVGLDGCHLKGRFGGHILSATARDGNGNIFPVSMAVVEQESLNSWKWFLQLFKEDIGDPEELKLVFIFYRQKVPV